VAEERAGKDFFISYASADRRWAEWIAVELEQLGYTTVVQSFDFRPGADFVQQMQEAAATARRTIAVMSPAYFGSRFGAAEWRAAFARDPSGERGLLIPVRVRPCDPPGLLATRIYVDLVGTTEPVARRKLRAAIDPIPNRPTATPFPGAGRPVRTTASVTRRPRFPGSGLEMPNPAAPATTPVGPTASSRPRPRDRPSGLPILGIDLRHGSRLLATVGVVAVGLLVIILTSVATDDPQVRARDDPQGGSGVSTADGPSKATASPSPSRSRTSGPTAYASSKRPATSLTSATCDSDGSFRLEAVWVPLPPESFVDLDEDCDNWLAGSEGASAEIVYSRKIDLGRKKDLVLDAYLRAPTGTIECSEPGIA
jgi:hypothetical protein